MSVAVWIAPYVCPDCKRTFKTSQGLGSHWRWYHAPDYACPVCGRPDAPSGCVSCFL